MLTKHASARAAAASLLLPLSALLAGCDGPSHPSPPLKVELAGAEAT